MIVKNNRKMKVWILIIKLLSMLAIYFFRNYFQLSFEKYDKVIHFLFLKNKYVSFYFSYQDFLHLITEGQIYQTIIQICRFREIKFDINLLPFTWHMRIIFALAPPPDPIGPDAAPPVHLLLNPLG